MRFPTRDVTAVANEVVAAGASPMALYAPALSGFPVHVDRDGFSRNRHKFGTTGIMARERRSPRKAPQSLPQCIMGPRNFFSTPWHLRQQRYEDHDAG
jgi:hypothetical protein